MEVLHDKPVIPSSSLSLAHPSAQTICPVLSLPLLVLAHSLLQSLSAVLHCQTLTQLLVGGVGALPFHLLRISHNGLCLLYRKLYFAQSHKPPYHGRVCVAPPGCLLSSSPDGPTKGILYVPSEKGK